VSEEVTLKFIPLQKRDLFYFMNNKYCRLPSIHPKL
jgi:hypothetical protein